MFFFKKRKEKFIKKYQVDEEFAKDKKNDKKIKQWMKDNRKYRIIDRIKKSNRIDHFKNTSKQIRMIQEEEKKNKSSKK